MSDSLNTHGALSESLTDNSHREGKGREGNRKGRDVGHSFIPTHHPRPAAMQSADDGGGW